MNAQEAPYIIVGLGNPGKGYERTRHNIGFLVVQKLAEKKQLKFYKKNLFYSLLTEWTCERNQKVIFCKPQTFMNSSGEAVKKLLSYYRVPLGKLCIVCDDIYLPFGKMRIKASGGSGGHNGLKSISSHLGTDAYPRLRVGVGDRKEGDLADHVLSPFHKEEEEQIPNILHQGCDVLECWLNNGIIQAAQCASACEKQKLGE